MKSSLLILALALSHTAFADGRAELKGEELTCGDVNVRVEDDGFSMTLRNERLNVGGVAQIRWHGEGSNVADLIYPDRPAPGYIEYNPSDDKFILNGIKCD